MIDDTQKVAEQPIWAREEAFPESPGGWGWMDLKQRHHPCQSAEDLIAAIRDDRDAGVVLAWTPEQQRMILPEEVIGAADAILVSRKLRAVDDMADSLDKLLRFGCLVLGVMVYMFYQGWEHAPQIAAPIERLQFAGHAVLASISTGICLLMFLIFAFIPWYQSRKRLRELAHWSDGDLEALIPILRFETWLDRQRAPVTWFLLILMTVVGLVQLLPSDALSAAGLDKGRYFAQHEWWRILTAPFLHGNIVHFLMNASALLYLGKRLEVFARWPHVPLVFLFSACVGGEASARFLTAASVGASGGLMGWLGFLLVFEFLHGLLVPRAATRRLLAGVLLTALIGLIGFRFIDNAAHAGGLLAGMLYALIVFPKSPSPNRPNSTLTDRIAGALALSVLVIAALLALQKIITA